MKPHTKLVISAVVLGAIAMVIFKLAAPLFLDNEQRETSDSKSIKGRIVIGVDNWIGYFPLCSQEMRSRMRRSGYNLQCEDDKADYQARIEKLADGDLQMAVATVDSYLLNGKDKNYPGTIITVIDESKGGDAVVAWKDKANSLDSLKAAGDLRVTYTPNSPSDHLIKSMAVHFDIPLLKERKSSTHIHADGSEDALEKLIKKKADIAVLWEPDVTKALQNKSIVKLLGTEDTNKLIVDILIVNRKYAKKYPEAVKTLLKNYFYTIKYYKKNPDKLVNDASKETDLKKSIVRTMLKGVSWKSLTDNSLSWFGVSVGGNAGSDWLVETIESASQILVDNKDFKYSPIPDDDPYRLMNSSFVTDLYAQGSASTQFGSTVTKALTAGGSGITFEQLNDHDWNQLRVIGTLKIRPIVFNSGTSNLTRDGKQQLDKAVINLKHYPNFRLMVKGHTGIRGDKNANLSLSQDRADSVSRYLQVTHSIQQNRVHSVGFGGSKPLKRNTSESTRSYNYKLPRVELFLVADDI